MTRSGNVGLGLRWRAMARVALRMSTNDKTKLFGTLFGVVLAILLTNHNLAMMTFLLRRNTQYIDNAGAQLWIVAPGTRRPEGGTMLPIGTLMQARVTPGVAWAE